MSSIYKHLAKADLKLEKDKPVLISPEAQKAFPKQPKLLAVKIGIVLAFAFAVAALVSTLYLFQTLNTEKERRESIEATYDQFRTESEVMKTESGQYRTEMERMRDQLRSYSSERNNLKKQLDRSRIEMSNMQKKVRQLENHNREIQSQTNRLRVEAARVRDTVPRIETLPPAVSRAVSPPQASQLRPTDIPALWKVMKVNKKFNFAVVNLGVADDAKIGDILNVMRKSETVGRLEIEKLYDNFAAAAILENMKNAEIREGDLVVRA